MPLAADAPASRPGKPATDIRLKRAYVEPTRCDGFRVLVDRLWPRGLTKAESQIDEWARDIAPSRALRKWFNHDPKRWDEFRIRYTRELADHPGRVERLRRLARDRRVTLVFAARDEAHNHAVVLRDLVLAAGPTKRGEHNAR